MKNKAKKIDYFSEWKLRLTGNFKEDILRVRKYRWTIINWDNSEYLSRVCKAAGVMCM